MRFDTLTLTLLASTALLSAAAVSLAMGAGQTIDWLPAGAPVKPRPLPNRRRFRHWRLRPWH